MSKGMRNRIQAANVYSHLYEYVIPDREDDYIICFYCGQPADTVDHTPPISRVPDYRCLYGHAEQYLLVAACRECNMIGGNVLHETVFERAEYIKDKLHQRYMRKQFVEWDPDELDELGRNLRSYVGHAIRKQQLAAQRIAYYYSIDRLRRHGP